jgi:hypothetical protein
LEIQTISNDQFNMQSGGSVRFLSLQGIDDFEKRKTVKVGISSADRRTPC